MATKNNPGAFDCYANAGPDEPMFVLLGRDKHASALVHLWAVLRAADGEDALKVAEAGTCANSMSAYAQALGKYPTPVADVLMRLMEVVEKGAPR